jgi:hypothetical protein
MGVEAAGIERRPTTVRTLRRVRHDDVGMELRITSPTRSVPKRRADETSTLEALSAVVAPAHEHCLALQVAQRGGERLFVRGDDLTADLGSAERPRHRHRLRRGEGQIQRGDPVVRPAERAPVSGAPPAEERDEVVVADRAVQAEVLGGRASPVARDLGPAEVVVLGAVRDRAQVVTLLTRRELPDRQHTPTKRVEGAETRPPAHQDATVWTLHGARSAVRWGVRLRRVGESKSPDFARSAEGG